MSLESRYELVLSRETGFAWSVANRVVDKPIISVWMILIPILLVQYLISSRELKEVARAFAREFMLTKRLALEMARDMEIGGLTKEKALIARLPPEWAGEAAPTRTEIRARQRAEIEVLIDHYRRLLVVDGENFALLVRNAYPSRDDYMAFLERLFHAESEVNRAAVRAFGETEGFQETIAKAETATRELRSKEMETIFPSRT